jgi:hypothetical protein
MKIEQIYYYDDEGNIYPTRIEAKKSGKICNFYYYDDFFSSCDWTKEPKESLQELYRLRAQEIRDKYEYVCLCYSGGIDSSQVLESFYYNNIHIDEILIVGALSQDSVKGSDENHNGDIYHNCFPTLNSMHLPNTKISVMDYTDYFDDKNNFTLLLNYGKDYYKHIGTRISLHNLFWYDLDKFLNHKKNTAYVFGKDKPIINIDNHGHGEVFYCMFYDSQYTDYGFRYKYDSGDRVHFYSEPEAFNIIAKQIHSVKKRCLETTNRSFSSLIPDVIYDLKNPLKHKSPKSKFVTLSARDMFFTKNKNSDIYDVYSRAMQKMGKEVDIFENTGYSSKRYYFG